jgi:hypothetical protein
MGLLSAFAVTKTWVATLEDSVLAQSQDRIGLPDLPAIQPRTQVLAVISTDALFQLGTLEAARHLRTTSHQQQGEGRHPLPW